MSLGIEGKFKRRGYEMRKNRDNSAFRSALNEDEIQTLLALANRADTGREYHDNTVHVDFISGGGRRTAYRMAA